MPEAYRSLRRLLPRLESALAAEIAANSAAWHTFRQRLETRFKVLFDLYYDLYHTRYDFFYHLEDLLFTLARAWLSRPADLRTLDTSRESDPLWFQNPSRYCLGELCALPRRHRLDVFR